MLLFFFGTDCVFVGAITIYRAFQVVVGKSNVAPDWMGLVIGALGILLTSIAIFLLNKSDKPQQ